jgi:D-alanine-D-alanine ligase
MRLGIIGGGANSEHEVSLASADSIASTAAANHDIIHLTIGRAGHWTTDRGDALAVDAAVRILRTCDVVFPALHGVNGEDGMAAALLTAIGVPYIGSDIGAGAIGMDKWVTKLIASELGIGTAPGTLVRAGERPTATLPELPVVVKPVAAGSSHGVSFVDSAAEVDAAVIAAFEHDDRVLIEEAVMGREVDIAVLERSDGSLTVSPTLEIDLGGDDVFGTERKYGGTARFVVPANVSPATRAELESCARRLFRALGCRGIARFDFFVTNTRLVLNEVNTMPGFTAESQVPRMFGAMGMPYADLIDALIETAMARR